MMKAKLKSIDYITALEHNEFTFRADEPIELGGSGTAPTPMVYLHGALASCVAITLRMYANRKKWQIGDITVLVNQTKGENGETVLTKLISFSEPISDDQRSRLANIAEKCPVAKLLKGGVEQHTKIV